MMHVAALCMATRRWLSSVAQQAKEVDFAVAANGLGVLTLQRPAAKNALGRNMIDELRRNLQSIAHDPAVRVLLIKSSVEKVFCAGADLKERATMNPAEVARFVSTLRSTFNELQSLPLPTIAVIDGAALGGGLELAMSCDFRYASSTSILGLPETRLAIIPGAGGSQLLPRLVGASKAKELIFTGRRLQGQDALSIGLITHCASGISAYDDAVEFAKEMLAAGPVALRAAKVAIDKGMQVDLATAMQIEQLCYAQVINTKDRLEGLAAFREKRKPVYKGE